VHRLLFIGLVALASIVSATAHERAHDPDPHGASRAAAVASRATPWAERDPRQLELLRRLAEQEAAYRARGEHERAAALRSRMRAIEESLCLEGERPCRARRKMRDEHEQADSIPGAGNPPVAGIGNQ